MKTITTVLAGTALMLGVTATAYAVPTLTLTNGSTIVTVPGTEAADPANPSVVSYYGQVGDFFVNVTTGISILGTSYMHLNSVDLSNSLSTTILHIKFSETGFSQLVHDFDLQFGGVADGQLTFSAFYDPNNLLNAETTQIGSTLTNPTNGAFSASGSGQVDAPGTYSLTEEVTITHGPGMHTSSFDAVTTVPEPASLVLMGTGFFSLAIYGKRRRKA